MCREFDANERKKVQQYEADLRKGSDYSYSGMYCDM